MFLGIRKFSDIKDPKMITEKVETELVPKIRDLPGFIAYYAVKFDNGDYGPVGIFETKENVDNWLEQADSWLKQNVPDVANKAETLRGEVLFSAAGQTKARSA